MNFFKHIIVTLSLVFSLGFIPATAFAAGPPTASSAIKGINTVIEHSQLAITAIDASESKKNIKEHIKAALRESKEIVGTELLEKKRLKFSRSLKKARSALKKDDLEGAKNLLNKT